jgi:hypothetical protein
MDINQTGSSRAEDLAGFIGPPPPPPPPPLEEEDGLGPPIVSTAVDRTDPIDDCELQL